MDQRRHDDDFDTAYESSADSSQFIVDRFLVNQLLRLARQTDGDFDSLMIWSVLALQAQAAASRLNIDSLPKLRPAGLLPDALLRADGLRSSDLAQVTGIPRETVRRKLERMQAKGRVERHQNGRWHAVSTGASAEAKQIALETARNLCEAADSLRESLKG